MRSRDLEAQAQPGRHQDMGGLPDALFVIDVDHGRIAITQKPTSWASRSSALSIPTAAEGVDM